MPQPLPHLPCTQVHPPMPFLTLPENEVLRLCMARRDGGVVGDLGEQGSSLEAALEAPESSLPPTPPPFPCEPEDQFQVSFSVILGHHPNPIIFSLSMRPLRSPFSLAPR